MDENKKQREAASAFCAALCLEQQNPISTARLQARMSAVRIGKWKGLRARLTTGVDRAYRAAALERSLSTWAFRQLRDRR